MKNVLDQAYSEIEGDEAAKDKAIQERLKRFRREYADIVKTGPQIDYRDPVSRFAYVFCYVTSHADMVADLVYGSPVSKLFDRDAVTISCIGGGPGSDLLGILKFLDKRKNKPKLSCFLLDRNKTWNECWCDLDSKLEGDIRLYSNVMELDVCKPDSYAPFAKYLNADLFTFVYFISEIYSQMATAQTFFEGMFSKMKAGAFVLFIDNNDANGLFRGWFDALAKKHGLKIVHTVEGKHQLDTGEEKKDLGPYYGRFGDPKLSANVAWLLHARDKTTYASLDGQKVSAK